MIKKKLKIVLAAGGTGGHIFPAHSLAEELINRKHEVFFITDDRYISDKKEDNFAVIKICAASPSGGIVNKIKNCLKLVIGFFQARKALSQVNPDYVVGFGGYPSYSTLWAARLKRIPIILHEQNSVLGRVNRLFVGKATKLATSFEKIFKIPNKHMNKVVFTGNPVRSAVVKVRDIPYPELKKNSKFKILVLGGSQGASVLSDIVPKAICALPKNLRSRIRIDQQCRKKDISDVVEIYKKNNIDAELGTFFVDVPTKIAGSHLIIARAGASTISEIAIAGRPSILIPYPYATDDHQMINAKVLGAKNAAIVYDQSKITSDILTADIKVLIENPEDLKQMAINAFDIGVPEAAKKLADLLK